MGVLCPFFHWFLRILRFVSFVTLEDAMRTRILPRFHKVVKQLRCRDVSLMVVWSLGLLLGAVFSPGPGNALFALAHWEGSSRVPLISHLATVSLPLLLTAYVVSIRKPHFLLVISFIRAFQFTFCGGFIYSLYGSAGWLVRLLLQFTDIFSVPILCWFSLRHISGDRGLNKKDFRISLALTLIVGCIDYFAISPFFARLIDI